MITLKDVVAGVRFFIELRSLLRNPVTLDEAQRILAHRLVHREDGFLALAGRAIYGYPDSPYLPLLRLAGCEYGDLDRLVRDEGVEGTLQVLYRQGVYLSVDEAKGKRPVVRGSGTYTIDPAHLWNPFVGQSVMVWRPGSRSEGQAIPFDLALTRDKAVNRRLEEHARGAEGWFHAIWGVPGRWSLDRILEYSGAGTPRVHWFSQVDPGAPGLHPGYHWSGRLLRWAGLAMGVHLPTVEYVPLAHPTPIARWMESVLQAGGVPHLRTFVSPAVRLCEAAARAGIDIAGAQLTVGGEPATPERMAAIRASGAVAVPAYGSGESSNTTRGCLAPEASDEVHFFQDWNALIQPAGPGVTGGLPRDALLVSSMRATARQILLNVSLGDTAIVSQRSCGCPMEAVGWTTHLHTIRSFEKLTAGGMTFFDTDVIRVLEVVLPARFGGGPTDYQLVEEDAEGGRPRLRLFVHPRVGPLDAAAVADAFLAGIGGGSPTTRVMELMWREAGFLVVEREPPRVTASGKILHLHTGTVA